MPKQWVEILQPLLTWSKSLDKPIQQNQLHGILEELNGVLHALEVNQKHFEDLYGHIPLVILALSNKGTILRTSDNFLKLLGYPKEQLVGESILSVLARASASDFRDKIYTPFLSGSTGTLGVELHFKHEKGHLLDVFVSAYKEVDVSGNGQLVLVISDVEHLTVTDGKDHIFIDTDVNQWITREFSRDSPLYDYFPAIAKVAERTARVKSPLETLDFDALAMKDDSKALKKTLEEMFHHFDLLQQFHIDPTTLRAFFDAIAAAYNTPPYHHFAHAVDVTQMIFYFLTAGTLDRHLTNLDVLALFIATIAHDAGHDGFTNGYQEAVLSDIAIAYSNQSNLEQEALHRLFRILSKPETNILSNLSEGEFRQVRKTVISCILATDLQAHFELLSRFTNRIKGARLDTNVEDNRFLLMQIAIKCADIGNAVRPFAITKKWSVCVLQEFFIQGDMEKQQKLPVSMFMDRNNTKAPQVQQGFLEYIVRPLYHIFITLLPSLKTCSNNLEKNFQEWKSLI